MTKNKKRVMVVMMVMGGLMAGGGLTVWWVNSPPGFTFLPIRNPDSYMGRIPPLTKLETYPRLVPWELESTAGEDAKVLMLDARSYACNLRKGSPGQVRETFDRVEIYETTETVTIETWLGPPAADGFWPGCKGTAADISVRVELDVPPGNRELVDPACDLHRFNHLLVCRPSSNPEKFSVR